MMTDTDKSQIAYTENKGRSNERTYPTPGHVLAQIARMIKSSNLPLSQYQLKILNFVEEGSERGRLNLRIERAGVNVSLSLDIDDSPRFGRHDKVTDDEGNVFLPETYEVKVGGSSWGKAIVLAKLIQDVAAVASEIKCYLNGLVTYRCVSTAKEVVEAEKRRTEKQNQFKAEKIIEANRARLRTGKSRPIRRLEENERPTEGHYFYHVDGKDFSLEVSNPLCYVHRCA
jgi:hypothetical protein